MLEHYIPDMNTILGTWDDNAYADKHLYTELFPTSRHPDHKTIQMQKCMLWK